MTFYDRRPKSGQWVEVWECDGNVWANSFRKVKEYDPETDKTIERIEQYNQDLDNWEPASELSPSCKNIKYITT